MPLIPSILNWLNVKRIHQMNLFREYPVEVQEEELRKLLSTAKDTEWGKKYDFQSIKTFHDFKKRVPLQDYNDIKPFVNRLREGEVNLLWPGEIKWFAKSSGTTEDKSKFIPVSKEAFENCHFRGGKDILAIYASNNPETEMFCCEG